MIGEAYPRGGRLLPIPHWSLGSGDLLLVCRKTAGGAAGDASLGGQVLNQPSQLHGVAHVPSGFTLRILPNDPEDIIGGKILIGPSPGCKPTMGTYGPHMISSFWFMPRYHRVLPRKLTLGATSQASTISRP